MRTLLSDHSRRHCRIRNAKCTLVRHEISQVMRKGPGPIWRRRKVSEILSCNVGKSYRPTLRIRGEPDRSHLDSIDNIVPKASAFLRSPSSVVAGERVRITAHLVR